MYSPIFARTLRCFVTIANEKRVLKDARTTARVIQTALICPYGPLDLSSTPKTGSEMEGFIMKRGGPPLTPPSPRLARLALSNKCLARSDKSRHEPCSVQRRRDAAVLHMEDTDPQPLTQGTGPTIASPQRSLWQTGCSALKMILQCSWGMRASGHVQVVNSVNW